MHPLWPSREIGKTGSKQKPTHKQMQKICINSSSKQEILKEKMINNNKQTNTHTTSYQVRLKKVAIKQEIGKTK